jgi:predicted Rossmann fold flavoprotein
MTTHNSTYPLVIIGGGAAGIVAAIAAARKGARVLLCEKMQKLGKKVRISGNGRCNISNDVVDTSCFNSEASELVESALSRFGQKEIARFFKELGLRVYSDEGRIFPITNQSGSVMDLLELELARLGVEIRLECEVTSLRKSKQGDFHIGFKSGAEVQASRVILTAGGKSYPIGGTDGSAYAMALAFGHHLVEPVPSTVPLLSDDPWCKTLSGQRIKAAVRYRVGEEVGPRIEGDLLFTDYGLSGTATLDSSEEISISLGRSGTKDTALIVDLIPFMHEDELKKELSHRMRRKFPSDKLIAGILPPKFAGVMTDELKRLSPNDLTDLLKNREFRIIGTKGWNEAEFTAGGIDHHEIDFETFESKKCPGLYLAGEILDVNGKRGGFNLAWAWSSGTLAGQAAAI